MYAYAGIGSRQTPENVQQLMVEIGAYYAELGYTLRSGGAQGADKAFESGCDRRNGAKEVFTSQTPAIDESWAQSLVWRFHPNPHALKPYAFRLMARNSLQVFGENGDNPVRFIFCWTPDGKIQGGTGQALRIAEHYAIPVYNLGKPTVYEWVYGRLIG